MFICVLIMNMCSSFLLLIMANGIASMSSTTEISKDAPSTETSNITDTTIPPETIPTTEDNNTPPDSYTLPDGFTMPTGITWLPQSFLLSTTGKPPETTMLNRYVFESVDYEELPQKLKDDYRDCYGQHIRCVRHRTDHVPVCAYNLWNGYYSDFYGPCEIDLQNCYQRMKNGFGVYGTNYKNDIIFYNGEGYNCIYYLRMARTKEEMDDMYFGDEIYRLGERGI